MAKENWLIGVQCKGGLSGKEEGISTFYVESYYADTSKSLAAWLFKDPRVTGTATWKNQRADNPSKVYGVWDGERA